MLEHEVHETAGNDQRFKFYVIESLAALQVEVRALRGIIPICEKERFDVEIRGMRRMIWALFGGYLAFIAAIAVLVAK